MKARQNQDNSIMKMPSAASTSVSDLSCATPDGIPYFGGGRGGYECELPDDGVYDDHHPDTTVHVNHDYNDDFDEYCYDGVGDPREYISTHYRSRDFTDQVEARTVPFQDLLRLELRVAELEAQLKLHSQADRDSVHEERLNDTSMQHQKVSLEQENTILMRKLVGMHEELFAERVNAMKSQALMKDKLSTLKSEIEWTCDRNDSLLKKNLELKSMLKRSEKVKVKRRPIEGELVCPFPMNGERQVRRMSSESNASSSIAETVEPYYMEFRSDFGRLAEDVSEPKTNPRRAAVQSSEVYVPFPKETRRRTVTGPPFSSKRSGLIDTILSFLPRRSRNNSNVECDCDKSIDINTDDNPVKVDQPNTSPELFEFSSRWHPLLQEHQRQEQERIEQHESWSPADEINIQTELFNFKSMAKIDKSYRSTYSGKSATQSVSEVETSTAMISPE